MNKRIEKMVKNYEVGKVTVRRDQLKKAIEEGAVSYMIYRGYDEIYDVEPVKMDATIDNIPDYWFRNSNIYCRGIENNTLKITMCYGYSYRDLYINLEEKKEEEKEVATIENTSNTEGVEVVYNDEKNGIEIIFASKELATEEIRTELKAVGFKYFFKLGKWIAKQNDDTITTVNKLFGGSTSEAEEIDVTEEVEEMLKEENTNTYEELINCNDFNDITTIKNVYCINWDQLPEELQNFILSCDRYWIYGSQELVLYKDNKGVASLQINVGIENSRDIQIISAGGAELFQWSLYKGFTANNLEGREELNDNLIIHIEGEGSVETITTSNVIKATENLNKRILAEYNENCEGYSKTFITLTVNNETYKFRYDIDNKLNLATNIFKFILEQENAEYNYIINNIEKFKWINEENYKNEYKVIFELLNDLIEKNNIDANIENNPYTAAVEEIKEVELYEVNASHNWIIKDSRLIKNEYFNGVVLATGKAIKEFIDEGKRIDVFNLKRYKGDLKAFMEGLYKCDTGKIISLIPAKEDKELMTVKMLPRLENELARI